MAENTSYTGGCHCGANKFQVSLPKVDSPETKLSACNCSICSRNGYIWASVKDADTNLKWTSGGPSAMTQYTFKTKTFRHYFCPTCGSSICASHDQMGTVLNVRMLDDVEADKLKITSFFDGKAL